MSQSLQKKQSLSKVLPMLGALATVGLMGLSGCDTVARISFPDVKFDKIEVAGMTPPSASCGGSSGDAKLRFVLLDNTKSPITPETTLDGQSVSLTKGSITLEQTSVFSVPDEVCESNADCLQSDFTCAVSQMNFEPALKRCFSQGNGIGVKNDPSFLSDLKSNQLFGVMMENTGTLNGLLPSSLTTLFPDLNKDGKGQSLLDIQGQRRERASDHQLFRVSGLKQMATTWKLMAEASTKNYQVQNYFGLWTFANSSASIESVIGQNIWTDSPNAVDSALNRYPSTTNSAQASVFESTNIILGDEEAYADPRFAAYEKVLVLFVDGPDELRLKSQDAQSVITAAKAVNAKIFIIHLDSAIDTQTPSGAPLLIDDPEYIKSQDGCMDDSGCKNFEECREITNFSTTLGGSTTIPGEDKKDKKFCLPKRDENGRIGPVDDYAEIACATGGSYMYVKSPNSLLTEMTWLPYVLDGLWEANIVVDAFSRDAVEGGQPYLFQTEMSVSLGGVKTTKAINQKGNIATDNRLVLFKSE